MKVVAVMPAYQEENRVRDAVLGVQRVVTTVVVVDDGSSDQTAENARQAGAVVVRHAINRGQGAALKTGTEAALKLGAEVIVHVDADGQHDPEFLPSLVAPINRGEADVVFGSRFLGTVDGIPLSRRWLLVLARWFNSFVLGVPATMTDPQSGLRAMTRSIAGQLEFAQDRMAHCSEILRLVTRSSWRWQEVPIRIRYTTDSLAKGQKPWDAFKIVWQLFMGAFHK